MLIAQEHIYSCVFAEYFVYYSEASEACYNVGVNSKMHFKSASRFSKCLQVSRSDLQCPSQTNESSSCCNCEGCGGTLWRPSFHYHQIRIRPGPDLANWDSVLWVCAVSRQHSDDGITLWPNWSLTLSKAIIYNFQLDPDYNEWQTEREPVISPGLVSDPMKGLCWLL